MCLFRRQQTLQPPLPITGANQAAKSSSRPEKKDLLIPDEVADVSFGTKKKTTGKKEPTGAGALKIALNTGETEGGLNV